MRKYGRYLAESSHLAIVVVFLAAVAVNPDISPPRAENSLRQLVEEYFLQDTLGQGAILVLLEQFLQATPKKPAYKNEFSGLPRALADLPTTRAYFKTSVELKINPDEDRIETGNLGAEIAAMREAGFSWMVQYAMMEE